MKIYGTWEFLYVEIRGKYTDCSLPTFITVSGKKEVQSSRMLINDKG